MTPEHMKTTPEDIDLDRMKDDTISRQAVLKLLSTMPPEEAITKAMLIQSVKQMDAAQPSGPDNLVKDSQGLAKDLANDCISRKAAIDAIDRLDIPEDMCVFEILSHIELEIGTLPSAQPERKRGKWIPVTNGRGGHECSLCHSYAPSYKSGNEWLTDYCPNCGADMREDDHE